MKKVKEFSLSCVCKFIVTSVLPNNICRSVFWPAAIFTLTLWQELVPTANCKGIWTQNLNAMKSSMVQKLKSVKDLKQTPEENGTLVPKP